MKILAVTLLLLSAGFLVQAQNQDSRPLQAQPVPVRMQERENRQPPIRENIRQVKKDKHTEKCCVRKSEAPNPRRKD